MLTFSNTHQIKLAQDFKPFAQVQAEKAQAEAKMLKQRMQSKLHSLNNKAMLRESKPTPKAGGLHFDKSFFSLRRSLKYDNMMPQQVEKIQPAAVVAENVPVLETKSEKLTGNIFFDGSMYAYAGFKSKHKSEVLRHMHTLGLTHFFISADNTPNTKVSIIPAKYRS